MHTTVYIVYEYATIGELQQDTYRHIQARTQNHAPTQAQLQASSRTGLQNS